MTGKEKPSKEDKERLRRAVESIRGFYKYADVAQDLGWSPSSISQFVASGQIGDERYEELVAWLGERGFWPPPPAVKEQPSDYENRPQRYIEYQIGGDEIFGTTIDLRIFGGDMADINDGFALSQRARELERQIHDLQNELAAIDTEHRRLLGRLASLKRRGNEGKVRATVRKPVEAVACFA